VFIEDPPPWSSFEKIKDSGRERERERERERTIGK
jgi:hypothetical protein